MYSKPIKMVAETQPCVLRQLLPLFNQPVQPCASQVAAGLLSLLCIAASTTTVTPNALPSAQPFAPSPGLVAEVVGDRLQHNLLKTCRQAAT